MGRKPQSVNDLRKLSTIEQSPPENVEKIAQVNINNVDNSAGAESLGQVNLIKSVEKPITGQVAGGKITSLLVREVARNAALNFMPAASQILADKRVSIPVKLRLFELLLQYGVGSKPETGKTGVNVQNAVIALMPRQAANDVLPIANPQSGGAIALAGIPAPLKGYPAGDL